MQNGAGSNIPSSSFLTEEQRAALDAALKQKAAENAVKAKEHALHVSKSTGNRKSRNTKGLGGPKKAGGGGKFTWGSILTDGDQAETYVDKDDPNYDSEEERTYVIRSQHKKLKEEVQEYKAAVTAIVEEYFSSGDIGDVAESLEDLGVPGFMHYFVKKLVTTALDRNNREREMASVALSNLYANVIPPDQVHKGLGNLVDSIGDLVLDVPDAPELLSLFIMRAMVDDVLAPAFTTRIPDAPAAAKALKQKVEAALTARHSAEKVLRCWGSGAGLTYQDTKDSISRMLAEFKASGDIEEAARCLHALNVPFFHHEVVKQSVHMAMEAVLTQPSITSSVVQLLVRLSETCEVSAVQLHKGLARVKDSLEDLTLDNPQAKEQHEAVMNLLKTAGVLDMDESAGLIRRMSSASIASAVTHATLPTPVALHGVPAFKAAAAAAIQEYFTSSDVSEVAARLIELDEPGLLQLFVKSAVVASLDRKNRERELVSVLLSQLYPEVLDAQALSSGFTRLLAAADDLVLDCPDAVHLLALFLGRAIVDEALPPAFLTQVLTHLRSESLGVSVVKLTGSLLSARHGAEQLVNAWHGGLLSLDKMKVEIKNLLEEYLVGSKDISEACRSLIELGVPAYHHQVVVSALELAFSKGEKAENDVAGLLASLSSTAVISQTQMAKGFSRMRACLTDEALDYGPKAVQIFERIAAKAAQGGWLGTTEGGAPA